MRKKLLPHQLESGLVTISEMQLTKRWVSSIIVERKSGKNPDCIDGWLETDLPFTFTYKGKSSTLFLNQWTREDDETESDSVSESQRIAWTDPTTGLRVIWEVKRFLEFPAVEWLLRFENKGSLNTPIIENVQALDLRLKHSNNDSYLVHGAVGSRAAMDDFMPFTCVVPHASTYPDLSVCELGGDWPSSNRHLPFYNVETPHDRGVMVGIGWSGIWQARTKIEGASLRTCAGQKNMHLSLQPGESFRSPRLLLLFWEGKRLHGHNMFRKLLHQHYVPPVLGESQKPLVVTNAGCAKIFATVNLAKATEKIVLPLVDPFVKLGAEVFIIDAGWYETDEWGKNMGDWTLAKSKYPRGFKPISTPLAAADVAFGLWFSPEVATPDSVVAREHPEWVRANFKQFGHHDSLRIELPEAREWFLDKVRYLADHEGLTCFRQDYGGYYGDEPADRKGFSEAQETTALYAMWDTIIQEYPKMIMEGCCGGGRRIDLETLSRFHWHWMTDRVYNSENDQCSFYGSNLFLPGGLLSVFSEKPDDYSAWTSFAGQFGLGWQPLEDTFPWEQAKLQIERYKRIRTLLCGDFYPLTPYALDAPWLGYQFHRADLDQGFALVFHRPVAKGALLPDTDTLHCLLRGVTPKGRYRVQFERRCKEEILTGVELSKGLDIFLPELRTAEMIIYEAIRPE